MSKDKETTGAPSTETRCPFCKNMTNTGTQGGCHQCGRVKHNLSGRSNAWLRRKDDMAGYK